MNMFNRDKTALKLFVLICLFNRSNYLIPLHSILIKKRPIKPSISGNKKLKKSGKKPVKFKLKKEFKRTSATLTKNKNDPIYKKV